MKPRRLFAMIEFESTLPLEDLEKKQFWSLTYALASDQAHCVHQVQINVAKDDKKPDGVKRAKS